MIVERCQKFPGLTLGLKPNLKKKHATKETKHTANARPHENEIN
jgi:hypothetical protein